MNADRFESMALHLSGQPVPAPQFPRVQRVRTFVAPRTTNEDAGLAEYETAHIWRALAAEITQPAGGIDLG